jgi:hypothetical protein
MSRNFQKVPAKQSSFIVVLTLVQHPAVTHDIENRAQL